MARSDEIRYNMIQYQQPIGHCSAAVVSPPSRFLIDSSGQLETKEGIPQRWKILESPTESIYIVAKYIQIQQVLFASCQCLDVFVILVHILFLEYPGIMLSYRIIYIYIYIILYPRDFWKIICTITDLESGPGRHFARCCPQGRMR